MRAFSFSLRVMADRLLLAELIIRITTIIRMCRMEMATIIGITSAFADTPLTRSCATPFFLKVYSFVRFMKNDNKGIISNFTPKDYCSVSFIFNAKPGVKMLNKLK